MDRASAPVAGGTERIDCVVIGAGVIGLAVARELALAGREVVIVEREPLIGSITSARNSEVIHAGIYYPQGSLKARLCVEGRALLYDYCESRHVPHRRCGKLIVATSPEQLPQLEKIRLKASANGVHDLRWLSQAEAQALEPALQCVAALQSPSTGIVDSHALMQSLLADAEAAGATLALTSAVRHAQVCADGLRLDISSDDGSEMSLLARTVVNAAGLSAPAVAQSLEGLDPQWIPQPRFAKGNYYSLSGRSPFTQLIYPVPEPGGLGVHLTLDLGGSARFGPDVQWLDIEAESAIDYRVDPQRAERFYSEIRKYWPDLRDGGLQPAYAGVRPKISAAGSDADFTIQGPRTHGVAGWVNLFGIESPGLTSSLAIAKAVVQELAGE